MLLKSEDNEIPFIDKGNINDLLNSKYKMFICDCSYIEKILSDSILYPLSIDNYQIELESSFSALNSQLFSIGELIENIQHKDSSLINISNDIISNISARINQLNQFYLKKSLKSRFQHKKEHPKTFNSEEASKHLLIAINSNDSNANETNSMVVLNDFLKQLIAHIQKIQLNFNHHNIDVSEVFFCDTSRHSSYKWNIKGIIYGTIMFTSVILFSVYSYNH